MSRAATFHAAAKIIAQQKKLPRGYLHDDKGNYCTMGAVLKVLGINTMLAWDERLEQLEQLPEVRLLTLTLGEFYPRYENVSNWNDKRGRTPQEAVKFLKAAAYMANWYERKVGIEI